MRKASFLTDLLWSRNRQRGTLQEEGCLLCTYRCAHGAKIYRTWSETYNLFQQLHKQLLQGNSSCFRITHPGPSGKTAGQSGEVGVRGLKHVEGKRQAGFLAASGEMHPTLSALPSAHSRVAQALAAGEYEDAPLPPSLCSTRLGPSPAETTCPFPRGPSPQGPVRRGAAGPGSEATHSPRGQA